MCLQDSAGDAGDFMISKITAQYFMYDYGIGYLRSLAE